MLHPLAIFVMLCAGVFMVGWTYHAMAAITISSTIEAPPLQSAATISTPLADTAFTSSPIHVTGTCPDRSYVELSVNGSFKGVGWCVTGTYNITTSLYRGTNVLSVQDFNETDLQGPTSLDTVTVSYTPPANAAPKNSTAAAASGSAAPTSSGNSSSANSSASSSSANTPGVDTVTKPMLLTSDFQFHTFTEQKTFTWDLDLEGGAPPYNVTVAWGDGSTSHFRFPTDPVFSIRHTFNTSGYYAVVVKSVDTTGAQHSMQLAALITKKDGTAPFLNSSSTPGSTSSNGNAGGAVVLNSNNKDTVKGTDITSKASTARWLLLAWPSYLVVILMTVSFWLGEKRELQLVFAKHAQPQRRRRR